MRIALLAPVSHRLPPPGYGPWERVVADLAAGLAASEHDVTVFAAAGSEVPGRLVPTLPHPLDDWPSSDRPDPRIWEEIHIAEMARHAATGEFDVVHSHLQVHPLGYAALLPVPLVTTLHGAAWNRATHPALERFAHLPFVSISDAERAFRPDLNYVATVHNGVRLSDFRPGGGSGEYLVFAGRLSPEKAPDLAIDVALASGRRLVLAGIVEDIHRDYFDARVAPRIDGREVEYAGHLERTGLAALLGDAAALVMPLQWDEPFGLVVVESLMCGTPVIAWRRGAMPELVRDGITGALVDGVPDAVTAVERIPDLDRAECRRDAAERFSVEAMAAGYVAAYERAMAVV